MERQLPVSAQRVQDALAALGLQLEVVEMPTTTRTALEAARAIGCDVSQIVKSLVFRGTMSGKPYLVLASGSQRVDPLLVAQTIGESLERATPGFVRQLTGFAIGGVPPVGFPGAIETVIDQDLLECRELWAAAGTPFTVFSLNPDSLIAMTRGRVVRVA